VNLKLLSYNIRYGGIGRVKELAAAIRECAPDLVVFQEATRPKVVQEIAAETGMNTWAAQDGYSLGFMSRLEISRYEWRQPAGMRHHIIEILPAGTEFRIFGLHLSAIHSNWTERRRLRELHSLLKDIGRHQRGLHVLVGDFNTLAPGEEFDVGRLPPRLRILVWLSGGKIRWETIQIMLDADYLDGFRHIHPAEKGFTFPTWSPHLRLDYVFVPKAFSDRLKECRVVDDIAPAAKASDHYPLLIHLEAA
jgi:exodeoxyribonuclease-3